MKKSLMLTFVFSLLLYPALFGKDLVTKKVYISFSNSSFKIQDSKLNIVLKDGNKIAISKLKCYLSNITFSKNTEVVYQLSESYHLVDFLSNPTFDVTIPKRLQYTSIQFTVGIDSLTNINGAMGGDLDPTKGMYWTWQSGYINIMIEGASSHCSTRNKAFQFHLGGYQHPYNSVHRVSLQMKSNSYTSIQLFFNLDHFINNLPYKDKPQIMSPSEYGVSLSKLFASCFTKS